MACGSEGKDQGKTNNHGIVPGHAYSLLQGVEVVDKNGRTVRLCKVRNPWKKSEWNGAWSDNSSEWTPELK